MSQAELTIENGALQKDIAVATFYQSQYHLSRASFCNTQLQRPQWRLHGLQFLEVDSYQEGDQTEGMSSEKS